MHASKSPGNTSIFNSLKTARKTETSSNVLLPQSAVWINKRDMFTHLDLVFFDTTSIYFEGQGGDTLGQKGYTKDHRPDLNQMIVGAVIDNNGRPLCCEMWPGNTADVTTLIPVVDKVRQRFGIGGFCIVADRGMISAETTAMLDELRIPYILGARMRRVKDISIDVLSRVSIRKRFATNHVLMANGYCKPIPICQPNK